MRLKQRTSVVVQKKNLFVKQQASKWGFLKEELNQHSFARFKQLDQRPYIQELNPVEIKCSLTNDILIVDQEVEITDQYAYLLLLEGSAPLNPHKCRIASKQQSLKTSMITRLCELSKHQQCSSTSTYSKKHQGIFENMHGLHKDQLQESYLRTQSRKSMKMDWHTL